MAKVEYDIPETREFPVIPSIMEGAMAHSSPFIASEEFQTDMGFPAGEDKGLIDGWKEIFSNSVKRQTRQIPFFTGIYGYLC